jgi:hypothetical protein
VPLKPQRESVWDYPRPPRVEAVTDRISTERRDVLVQQVGGGAAPLLHCERVRRGAVNDQLVYG